jgi:hypothetical protein
MSKVAELVYDVQELYIDGMGARAIALTLECPIETVLEILEDFGVEDSDKDYPMDDAHMA